MRKAVRYNGRVQGVGFRATTRQLAEDLSVTGWVRNEPDGSVRLEVQGKAAEIESLLGRIAEAMGRLIRTSEVSDLSEVAGESGFVIRR
jgi:acylphosphatase